MFCKYGNSRASPLCALVHPILVQILNLLGWEVFLLLGLDATLNRMGSQEVSLLIGLRATLSGKGIVLAIRAEYYIYSDGKCPC